ncbi:hypothetical protein U1Q18_015157 [Sarracenia purpurea var. burkii]
MKAQQDAFQATVKADLNPLAGGMKWNQESIKDINDYIKRFMNSLVEGKHDPTIIQARQQLPQASTSAAAATAQGQPAPQAPTPKAPTSAVSTPQPS